MATAHPHRTPRGRILIAHRGGSQHSGVEGLAPDHTANQGRAHGPNLLQLPPLVAPIPWGLCISEADLEFGFIFNESSDLPSFMSFTSSNPLAEPRRALGLQIQTGTQGTETAWPLAQPVPSQCHVPLNVYIDLRAIPSGCLHPTLWGLLGGSPVSQSPQR